MEIIYLLIPVSLVLVIVIVAGFLWAARSGQFDDLDRRGRDILHDDDGPTSRHDK
ncbi:MAG: cbb3-type cytochrome oxidase assembly protein CcoS [Gammaproteobacteria bacterium]|nr:cbb3-type cytochrome oxidase assembly protein CcoS [Gammaproteobacteria bacterium]